MHVLYRISYFFRDLNPYDIFFFKIAVIYTEAKVKARVATKCYIQKAEKIVRVMPSPEKPSHRFHYILNNNILIEPHTGNTAFI